MPRKSMLGRRGNAKMPVPQPFYVPDSASRSGGLLGTGQKMPRKSMLGRRGNAKMPATLLVSVLASRNGHGRGRKKPSEGVIPRCLLWSLNGDSVASNRNIQDNGDQRKQQVHRRNLLSRYQIPSSEKENSGTAFEFTASRSTSGRKIGTSAIENKPKTPYMSPKAPLLRQSKRSRRVLNFVNQNEVNIESGDTVCLPESTGNGYISAPILKRSAKLDRHMPFSSQSTSKHGNVNIVHPRKKFKLTEGPEGTKSTLTLDKSQINISGLHVQAVQAISSEKLNFKSKIPQMRINYSSDKTKPFGAHCPTESETKKLAVTREISENLSSSNKRLIHFKTLELEHTKTDKTDALVIDEASTSGAHVFSALPRCVNSPSSSALNLGPKGKSADSHGSRLMKNSTGKKRYSINYNCRSEGISGEKLQIDDLEKYFKMEKPGEMKSADKYPQSHVNNSECNGSAVMPNDLCVQNIPPVSEITNVVQNTQSETSTCAQHNDGLPTAKDSPASHLQIVTDNLCSSKTKSLPNKVICHNSSSTSNVLDVKTNHSVHDSAQFVPNHESVNSASTQSNFTPFHDNNSFILEINKVLQLLKNQKEIDNEIEILQRKSNDIKVEIVNIVSKLGSKPISDTSEQSGAKRKSLRRSARIAALTSDVRNGDNNNKASSTPFQDESFITPSKRKSGNLNKSSAMYEELRQNFRFLKTPKNTPSRTLSRSVHGQLMSLYD